MRLRYGRQAGLAAALACCLAGRADGGERTERFDRDPGWEGVGNRREYETANVRPRFDFGYSPTGYAGGRAAGEAGPW